ncbi:hypothetical protein SAMN06269185_0409 [Natronoarchaeum philippinense]|uniref:Uncharacterized protein n=1 Tax=Natronoarchaeum philippinense TaxID=558529 RepID=A0A285N390_NATPI|nr:hypothetical protein [Natronoarchaeum philippinense]SNZ03944.1 hypothetical protein SAMN06269185_0409 [Natronoarchaeum philippinense]
MALERLRKSSAESDEQPAQPDGIEVTPNDETASDGSRMGTLTKVLGAVAVAAAVVIAVRRVRAGE